ncbi:CAP domain-containing protein [Sagittula sp. SSi028]|uniref:CAP domain-containing protein n=1 Tax=Sagittula sp. SSi028 TaxID=3400636 RepID=UPI003AF8A808
MNRRAFLALSSVAAIAACTSGPATTGGGIGPDGKPLPRVYRIGAFQRAEIEYRMLDSVNALRQASGAAPLELNSQLQAAAATHARDMSVQNRPWHFGSDGSSPVDRVQRVGYSGRLVGETISETYETETETLAAWMEEEPTRRVILDPSATEMGFSWYQEDNGKIWWCMVVGAAGAAQIPGLQG